MIFARASTFVTQDGATVAVNVPARKRFPRLVNDLNITRPSGQGVGGEDIYPIAGRRGGVFGRNLALTRLYRTTDGETWTAVVSGMAGITSVFCRRDGSLLFLADNPNASLYAASAADGWVPHREQRDGADFTQEGASRGWFVQSIGEAAHGTVLWGEYATATADLHIHRRDPGTGEWSTVFTLDQPEPTTQAHVHLTFYHEPSESWLLFPGDGGNRCILYSADDGQTLSYYTQPAEVDIQPIQARLDGDAIVLGADTTWGGYKMRLFGGPGTIPDLREVIPQVDRSASARYIFQLEDFRVADDADPVWVANSIFNSGDSDVEAMYAALGSEGPWITVARMPEDSAGIDLLFGPVTGPDGHAYLIGREGLEAGGVRQIKFRLPELEWVNTTEIHSEVTNLLTEAQSLAGSGIINQTSDGGLTVSTNDATDPFYGAANCCRITRADGGNGQFVSAAINATVGQTYFGMAHIKGAKPAVGNMGLTLGGSADSFKFHTMGNNWTRLCVGAKVAGSSGEMRLRFGMDGKLSTAPAVIERDVRYAGFQIINSLGAQPFTPGGTTLAATTLTETRARGPVWRDGWTWYPEAESAQFIAPFKIVHYAAGNSSAEVYFDGSDATYKLALTLDGVAQTLLTTVATRWSALTQIDIDCRFTPAGTIVSIKDGGPATLTLSGAALPDLLNSDVTLSVGGTGTTDKLWMNVHRRAGDVVMFRDAAGDLLALKA